MAWFETLNVNDTIDLYTVLNASNRISSNIFMPVVLLVIYFVLVLGFVFSGKPIHRSVLYGSFVYSILSILMVIMNWLSTSYMYFAFFMVAISVVWTWLSEAMS